MIGSENAERRFPAEENVGDLSVDEAGIGVLGEARLDWLDVGEFGGGWRGKDGGGDAGGD